jgi:hypothetical protein
MLRNTAKVIGAAASVLSGLAAGGYFSQLGIERHGSYEHYGTYVVLSWLLGLAGIPLVLYLLRKR